MSKKTELAKRIANDFWLGLNAGNGARYTPPKPKSRIGWLTPVDGSNGRQARGRQPRRKATRRHKGGGLGW